MLPLTHMTHTVGRVGKRLSFATADPNDPQRWSVSATGLVLLLLTHMAHRVGRVGKRLCLANADPHGPHG